MSEYIDLYDVDRQLTGDTMERKDKQAADRFRLIARVCIFDISLLQEKIKDLGNYSNNPTKL